SGTGATRVSSRGYYRSSASTLAAVLAVTTALAPLAAAQAQQVGPAGPGMPAGLAPQQETQAAEAQGQAAAAAAPVDAAEMSTVRAIAIEGNQRLEPETVRSYMSLSVGDPYDRDVLDQALK